MNISNKNKVILFGLFAYATLIIYKIFSANQYINNDGYLYMAIAQKMFSGFIFFEQLNYSYYVYSFVLKTFSFLFNDNYLLVSRFLNFSIYIALFLFFLSSLEIKTKKNLFLFLLVFLSADRIFSNYLLMTFRDPFFWFLIVYGVNSLNEKNNFQSLIPIFLSALFRFEGFIIFLFCSFIYFYKYKFSKCFYFIFSLLVIILCSFIFYFIVDNYISNDVIFDINFAKHLKNSFIKSLGIFGFTNLIIFASSLLFFKELKQILKSYKLNFYVSIILFLLTIFHQFYGNGLSGRYFVAIFFLFIQPLYHLLLLLNKRLGTCLLGNIFKGIFYLMFVLQIIINFRPFNYQHPPLDDLLNSLEAPYENYSTNDLRLYYHSHFKLNLINDRLQKNVLLTKKFIIYDRYPQYYDHPGFLENLISYFLLNNYPNSDLDTYSKCYDKACYTFINAN